MLEAVINRVWICSVADENVVFLFVGEWVLADFMPRLRVLYSVLALLWRSFGDQQYSSNCVRVVLPP